MQAEVFDEVFRQMRRDYKLLAKPALLMAAVWAALAVAFYFAFFLPFYQGAGWPIRLGVPGQMERVQEVFGELGPRLFVLLAAVVCLYVFFHLVLIFTCRQVRDRKPDLRKALGDAARRWPHYMAAVLLLSGIAAASLAAGLALANGLSPPPADVPAGRPGRLTPLHGEVLAVEGLVGLYVGIRLNLFPFAIALEKDGAWRGIVRSWRATRGQWWSMFLALGPLALLLLILIFVVGLVASLAVTAPAGLTPFFALPTGHYAPGEYPVSFAWNQATALAMNYALGVFILDVSFTYGHTVVWEITQARYRPSRPTAAYAKKYAAAPKPAPRLASTSQYLTQKPSDMPPVGAWRPPKG